MRGKEREREGNNFMADLFSARGVPLRTVAMWREVTSFPLLIVAQARFTLRELLPRVTRGSERKRDIFSDRERQREGGEGAGDEGYEREMGQRKIYRRWWWPVRTSCE